MNARHRGHVLRRILSLSLFVFSFFSKSDGHGWDYIKARLLGGRFIAFQSLFLSRPLLF